MTNNSVFSQRAPRLLSRRDEVAQWLSLYPSIGDDARQAIIAFLKSGRSLDFHHLMSDEPLRRNLRAFVSDHRAELEPHWHEIAAMAAAIAAVLVLVVGFGS